MCSTCQLFPLLADDGSLAFSAVLGVFSVLAAAAAAAACCTSRTERRTARRCPVSPPSLHTWLAAASDQRLSPTTPPKRESTLGLALDPAAARLGGDGAGARVNVRTLNLTFTSPAPYRHVLFQTYAHAYLGIGRVWPRLYQTSCRLQLFCARRTCAIKKIPDAPAPNCCPPHPDWSLTIEASSTFDQAVSSSKWLLLHTVFSF